jgi:hypothetical protein
MNLESLGVQKVVLERYTYAVQQIISREALDAIHFRIEDVTTEIATGMALRLVAEITSTQPQVQVVEYPATWWDAFKLRWFPRWALKRWPALMGSTRVEARALLIDIPPEFGRRVFVAYSYPQPALTRAP